MLTATTDALRAALERAARDLAYLAIALVTSIVAMVVWITGVSVSLSLVVFVIGLPVVLGSAIAFHWIAGLDRRNAARVLGQPLSARYREHHGGGRFLTRLSKTVRDPQTWGDLAWLVVHSVVGLVFGCIALSLVAEVVGLATLPLWYWAVPEETNVAFGGAWELDTVAEQLAAAVFAIPLAAATVVLLRGMAIGHAKLAAFLLGAPIDPAAAEVPATAAEATLVERMRARDLGAGLAVHGSLAAVVGFTCALLWSLTGRGYFWPVWVWLGLATVFGLHVVAVRAIRASGDPQRAFVVRAELCAEIALLCVAIWALAGGGYFWPVWPALGMAAGLAARGLFVFRHRLPWMRERRLVERVDELTRTRRGALDVQAAELRRIERDLHDGAQARLVALSMQLGRAEERLGDEPEAADLVRQARHEASAAIAELRDLARGIAPPVLADRGLQAAVEALGRRSPIPVSVQADVDRRPPPVLETAAYFVVAESLTNAAKHAGDATAQVVIGLDAERLAVEVADDGPGGADADGSGLTGLRHRVEALDGSLRVISPAGKGTVVRAELPCG